MKIILLFLLSFFTLDLHAAGISAEAKSFLGSVADAAEALVTAIEEIDGQFPGGREFLRSEAQRRPAPKHAVVLGAAFVSKALLPDDKTPRIVPSRRPRTFLVEITAATASRVLLADRLSRLHEAYVQSLAAAYAHLEALRRQHLEAGCPQPLAEKERELLRDLASKVHERAQWLMSRFQKLRHLPDFSDELPYHASRGVIWEDMYGGLYHKGEMFRLKPDGGQGPWRMGRYFHGILEPVDGGNEKLRKLWTEYEEVRQELNRREDERLLKRLAELHREMSSLLGLPSVGVGP